MTDREKLIELLVEARSKDFTLCNDHAVCKGCEYEKIRECHCACIADHLIANGVTLHQWIPVTERLPEYDLPKDSKKKVIKVLVAIISKRGVYTIRTQTRQKGYYYNYPDEWDWGKYSSGLITHWMPLPEPPKGEN